MTVSLRAHTTSGSMGLDVDLSFEASDLDDALRRIRQAVGDAVPIFTNPDQRERS